MADVLPGAYCTQRATMSLCAQATPGAIAAIATTAARTRVANNIFKGGPARNPRAFIKKRLAAAYAVAAWVY
jgi:hypothetical protein